MILAVVGSGPGPNDQIVDGFRSVLMPKADDVLAEPTENGVCLRADLALTQPHFIACSGPCLPFSAAANGGGNCRVSFSPASGRHVMRVR